MARKSRQPEPEAKKQEETTLDLLTLKAGEILRLQVGEQKYLLKVCTAADSLAALASYTRAVRSMGKAWEIDQEPPEITANYAMFTMDLLKQVVQYPAMGEEDQFSGPVWNALRSHVLPLVGLDNPQLVDVAKVATLAPGESYSLLIGETLCNFKMPTASMGEYLRMLRPAGERATQVKAWSDFTDKLLEAVLTEPSSAGWADMPAPWFGALHDFAVVFAGVNIFRGSIGSLQRADAADLALLQAAGAQPELGSDDPAPSSGLELLS